MPPATIENYDADGLGDDVLAVLAALKIEDQLLRDIPYPAKNSLLSARAIPRKSRACLS